MVDSRSAEIAGRARPWFMAGGEGEPVILCVLPSRCAFEWRQVGGDQKPERHALSNGGSGKRRDSRLLKG